MRGREKRKSNVMVTVVDLTKLLDELHDELPEKEIEKMEGATGFTSHNTYGFVDTPKGRFVLCTEGVGSREPLTKDDPMVIDVWIERDGDKFDMFPCGSLSIGPDQFDELPRKSERIPLTCFIREFGSRLEQNFHIWNRVLSDGGAADSE